MLVRDVMKEPVCVQAEETLDAAARTFKKENVGALPVCRDSKVIGMITDRDVTMRGVADARDVTRMTVREAMSVDVLYCFADDPVEEAERIMRERHVQRLAVLDRDDEHLIGIISLTSMSGDTSERRPYEVTFHKTFLDNRGRPHHAELMRVTVAQGTKEEAIRSAIHQFEEMNHVKVWHQLADGYDVTSVHVDACGDTVEEREPTSEREASILTRAHDLWELAGRPQNRDKQFWEQAAGDVDNAASCRE
ncbi:CBS domain-containing protein [Paraburkholderia terrae]|nr:CBS domain-containing protein [Paraburkholderia terrae]